MLMDLDLDLEEPKSERAVSFEVRKTQIKWNKEGKSRLCKSYYKGSRRTQMKY